MNKHELHDLGTRIARGLKRDPAVAPTAATLRGAVTVAIAREAPELGLTESRELFRIVVDILVPSGIEP